jgi:hypothetical protein
VEKILKNACFCGSIQTMRTYSTSNRQERRVILSRIALAGVYAPLSPVKVANTAFIVGNKKTG